MRDFNVRISRWITGILLFGFIPHYAQAKAPSYNEISFRSLLTADQSNTYQEAFSKECLASLKTFMKNGGTLKSERLTKLAVPSRAYAFNSQLSDSIFYHYTDAEAMVKIAKKNRMFDIFEFLRSRSENEFNLHEMMNLYVAEDPISSREYGKYQVRLHINPNAKILRIPEGQQPLDLWYGPEKSLLSDTLVACQSKARDSEQLKSLVLEESGIDLYDYYVRLPGQWFQVIRPAVVERIELGEATQW